MGIMKEKGDGKCCECFKKLELGQIICGPCQDECDGRWDHLRKNKEKKESH